MSSDDREVMISVRGLSKAYTIAHANQRATTLGEAAMRRLRAPFQREQRETFWALQDVSFDVRRGDVVGVIGRNGAGKSTLFKVLSRITEPTAGAVDLYGRVGSLLEVGTGFSGELTGRENIFLNGTILGMSRPEIAKRFDEIVAFSGVEKFLDTPVKRYSSGMYVRLAFAVAAHLESEILIVDEVLAVGDAEFQARCIGKMREVSSDGRTVLFVSHNLESVTALCTRAIALSRGAVIREGPVATVVKHYQGIYATGPRQVEPRRKDPGCGTYIRSVATETGDLSPESPKEFRCEISNEGGLRSPAYLALHVIDPLGLEVAVLDSALLSNGLLDGGEAKVSMTMDSPWLKPGEYRIDAFLYNAGIIDRFPDACRFVVGSTFGRETGLVVSKEVNGCVVPNFRLAKSVDSLITSDV